MSNLYDVLIIGGGPAGLTAAQYSARAGLKTLVIDKSPSAGALAYASIIENYPGFKEPIRGKDLLSLFREQAIGFGAQYNESQVIGVRLEGDTKEVYTMDSTYKCSALIIATGSMGRKPTIKGEAEFLGRGVSYCAVCDAAFYRGKKVSVIGGSEEALKEAEYLTRFADRVLLLSPVKLKETPGQIPNLEIHEGITVTVITGSSVVESLTVKDSSGKESTIPIDGVFIYLQGNKPITDFLGESLALTDEGAIPMKQSMETNIPGVFCAGDVTSTEVRQVVVAASQGCIAALSAEQYITKRKRKRFDWHK